MTLEWDFWAKLLFFLGFVWWAIKWTARNLRAQIGPTMPSRDDFVGLSADSAESIVASGFATRAQLAGMSAKEQRLLADAAQALHTRESRVAAEELPPPHAHCPHCGRLVDNWPAHMPWRTECAGCGSGLLVRRDGPRVVLSYDPPGPPA